jgi:hypothetical protein
MSALCAAAFAMTRETASSRSFETSRRREVLPSHHVGIKAGEISRDLPTRQADIVV